MKSLKISAFNSSLHSSLLILFTALAITSLGISGCSDTPMLSEDGSEDESPPTVVSSEPAYSSSDVSVDSEVTITFSEDIDEETVNMTFYNPSTNAGVQGTTEVSGSTLTFTPDEPFRPGSSYELLVFEVDDLAGNTLEEVYSLIFHTE